MHLLQRPVVNSHVSKQKFIEHGLHVVCVSLRKWFSKQLEQVEFVGLQEMQFVKLQG